MLSVKRKFQTFNWLVIHVLGFGFRTDSGDVVSIQLKGLILAQNERWRRGLGMQVARQVFISLLLKMEERRKGE